MPRGPKGEKRPADVIGAAIMVGRIATGEIEDRKADSGKDAAAVSLGRRGGLKGGKARAAKMSPSFPVTVGPNAPPTRYMAKKYSAIAVPRRPGSITS